MVKYVKRPCPLNLVFKIYRIVPNTIFYSHNMLAHVFVNILNCLSKIKTCIYVRITSKHKTHWSILKTKTAELIFLVFDTA